MFPTASGSPEKNGQRVVDAFNQYGASGILIPVAVKGLDIEYRQAVNDPALIQQVQECTGIYFIGGDQGRITQALYTEAGDRTPMLAAIWDVFNQGGMIGGSSAGAAIMSTTMLKDAIDVLSTLKVGVEEGSSIDRGLGFVGPDLFVDQHFLTRGRFARALVAMQAKNYTWGIGVDENLIDNTHREAIGLAFSQATDVVEPDLGFEFKFYIGADSIGYYTGAFGGEDYTVENIYLDVTPIQLSDPLFQQSTPVN